MPRAPLSSSDRGRQSAVPAHAPNGGAQPLSLRTFQERFFQVLNTGESATCETDIVSDARLNATARLAVYAEMYAARLFDFIAEDYPKLHALLGDEVFGAVVRRYLAAHPPSTPSARHTGALLPRFLTRDAVVVERPWLAELAALEWARVDVFDKADVSILTFDTLRAWEPQQVAGLVLDPVPACAVVQAAHAVELPWRQLEEAPASNLPRVPEPTPGALIVWRRNWVVYHRRMPAAEAQAFAMLHPGVTFAALCARLAETDAQENVAVQAAQWLAGWLQSGLLAAPPAWNHSRCAH